MSAFRQLLVIAIVVNCSISNARGQRLESRTRTPILSFERRPLRIKVKERRKGCLYRRRFFIAVGIVYSGYPDDLTRMAR